MFETHSIPALSARRRFAYTVEAGETYIKGETAV